MDDIIDLLRIKIEKAKAGLSEDTLKAIDAVDWRAVILGLREKKGYTFEQLGDLELETELLLCGLVSPENYPNELKNRMKISEAQTNELVNEMNLHVFAKIKEELIKNVERKKIFAKKTGTTSSFIKPIIQETPEVKKISAQTNQGLSTHGIEIHPADLTLPELPAGQEKTKQAMPSILEQKLSNSVKTSVVKTEHTLENLTKAAPVATDIKVKIPKVDPYREMPE